MTSGRECTNCAKLSEGGRCCTTSLDAQYILLAAQTPISIARPPWLPAWRRTGLERPNMERRCARPSARRRSGPILHRLGQARLHGISRIALLALSRSGSGRAAASGSRQGNRRDASQTRAARAAGARSSAAASRPGSRRTHETSRSTRQYRKLTDTLDVWFDSVRPTRRCAADPQLGFQADLLLEG